MEYKTDPKLWWATRLAITVLAVVVSFILMLCVYVTVLPFPPWLLAIVPAACGVLAMILGDPVLNMLYGLLGSPVVGDDYD